MFLGDKGKNPAKFKEVRHNYDVLVDNEKMTLNKLSNRLGFYSIEYVGKLNEVETVYDTPTNLLTGVGIVIRKKHTPKRTYFSLLKINSIKNARNSDRKEFLGECEPKDQPKDFPVQIADKINQAFNNLFTINLVDMIKHCSPYVINEITGNLYKIHSGTGYEAELSFETMNVKNARTGRRARVRIFSLVFPMDPNYEHEREQILHAIDIYCNELVPLNRSKFEIAEVEVKTRVPKQVPEQQQGKNKKDKKKKEE